MRERRNESSRGKGQKKRKEGLLQELSVAKGKDAPEYIIERGQRMF